ncbi:uncharacterized protein LOC115450896 [Manduca sexta]|uniref:uncharacterized protein LOC115450896 n=1 Tax=Manduca sexta TaxID=7130 RepID=UPI00188E2994|nr:uncharacterized protein LOC115450896 [Manduca sexta]
MGNHGPETSHEERTHRRLQIVYARKTRERQIFMQELKEIRKQRDKRLFKSIKQSIGPKWYQVLGVTQRKALDSLEFAIYQDILEGRPTRTRGIMKVLGLYPRPNTIDLMNCVYLGRHDPKEMLAQLFLMTYGHSIDGKQLSYCLNARLMLSGILYLGLDNLISLLRDRFRAEPEKKEPAPKRKPKSEPPLASPYLQKLIAYLYEPPARKPFKPAPLPNLDDLNDPLAYTEDEAPAVYKPPPQPPPPPPPKKRLPRGYCDKIAGVMTIEPYSSVTTLTVKTVGRGSHRRIRSSKICLSEVKKSYGIGGGKPKGGRRRKPVAPSTGNSNAQYLINGVYTINGKSVFVLGNVTILPASGDLIHGGYKYMGNECINIHCGYRARPPPPKPDPCDCVKKWQDTVLEYVKKTKCYCGHHYDYGNEGNFLPEDLPFFQKPTRGSPFTFNYHTIYDINEKRLYVEKEFKKIWDTDSVLHVDDGTVKDKKDKKKKKTKRSSTTCLGQNPKPVDYLKCALRMMKQLNVAARLPDIHLVPELKEWMRRRIYGPHSASSKADKLRKSSIHWQMFKTLEMNDYGHVYPPKDDRFMGETDWVQKFDLQKKFKKYTQKYRLELYRSYAYLTNLLWPSMCQAQFPDKKFREIYFSYLSARVEDLQLMHPYNPKEAAERKFTLARRRYVCLPAGAETLD